MSEKLNFYKGNESGLDAVTPEAGALYHCEDTGNTYLGKGNNEKQIYSSSIGRTRMSNNALEGGEVFNDYNNNHASGTYSHAEGESTNAYTAGSHAEGKSTHAGGKVDTTTGEITTNGAYAHAEGVNSIAYAYGSHAEGWQSLAEGQYSHAEGDRTTTYGKGSHAEGCLSQAKGAQSHAEGDGSIAYTTGSHAEGFETKAGGKTDTDINSAGTYAHVEGVSAIAYGKGSHAEGANTLANAQYSHAEGGSCEARGDYSHAEGCNNGATKTTASGIGAHAEGRGTSSSGSGSHSEGFGTTSSAIGSHSEGIRTQATANASHSEGMDSIASNASSHAEGYNTRATGDGSHSEGNTTVSSGHSSHAEGNATNASGKYSHSEGYGTSAVGEASHAEGNNTLADAKCSHSEGDSCQATGQYSHAEGKYTQTSGEGAHVEGYYRRIVYLEIVDDQSGYRMLDQNKTPLPSWLNGYYFGAGIDSNIESSAYPLKGLKLYSVDDETVLKATIERTYTVLNEDNYDLYAIIDTDLTAEITENPDKGYWLYYGKSIGQGSHAEGGGIALGTNSHAEGSATWAAHQSHAEGFMSAAMITGSHAEGIKTRAWGQASHSEGNNTFAKGYASHVEGIKTIAEGRAAHTEGGSTVAVGDYSHAEGYATFVISGLAAHTEGYNTQALGNYSHTEGYFTIANGNSCHAEGYATFAISNCAHAEGSYRIANHSAHAEGSGYMFSSTMTGDENSTTYVISGNIDIGDYIYYNNKYARIVSRDENSYTLSESLSTTSVSEVEVNVITAGGQGYYSHVEGIATKATGEASHAEGYGTQANINQHAQGHYNTTSYAGSNSGTGGTAFIIGNGTSTARSNAFRITYAGETYAKAAYNSSGADYAEFFEWADGNPFNEDRRGYFVTLDNDKIKIATPEDDYVLGAISGQPSIIGNSDEEWTGRYILDEFGSFITEEFEYKEEIFDSETGETIIITKTGIKYKENPEYDPTQTYIQRQDRSEWATVGMLGILSVRDDGTCQPNGYCTVSEDGIATMSLSGYRVIKRINDNIVKIIFK